MVSPELVAAGVVAVAVAAAAAYSYLTGNEASVDIDDDGDDELTFGGPTKTTAEAETPPTVTEDDDDGGENLDLAVEDLTDITGIGHTRAQDLHEAGIKTPMDVYEASDAELTAVDGIGDYTVEQIRSDIGSSE